LMTVVRSDYLASQPVAPSAKATAAPLPSANEMEAVVEPVLWLDQEASPRWAAPSGHGRIFSAPQPLELSPRVPIRTRVRLAQELSNVAEDAAKAPDSTPPSVEEAAPAATPQAEPPNADAAEEKPAEQPAPAPVERGPSEIVLRGTGGGGDPLDQLVNLDFRDMELSQVVALLSEKAEINIMGGSELTGDTVTANLKNVPLRKAIDMILRMEGLGIVEEEGIYRIVPYEEAAAAYRATRMVFLKNAKAQDLKLTLESLLVGVDGQKELTIAADVNTNTLILSGDEARVSEFEALAQALDVSEQVLPTVTKVLRLNYAMPHDLENMVAGMLTPETGKVTIDETGRHLIVTDYPLVVDNIEQLVQQVDISVKQVMIESMIVDVVLSDSSSSGIEWLANLLRRYTNSGNLVSNLEHFSWQTDLPGPGTNELTFGTLSSDFSITGAISAEVQNQNANLLANSVLVTVENKPANLEIVQEFPYRERTETEQGGQLTSTEFKDVGTILEVTPRVTHSNDIIVDVQVNQSGVTGFTSDEIPITNNRRAETTIKARNGQTIFIGGLRRMDDNLDVRKVPVLGDIPLLNIAFRNTDVSKSNTELMTFLTCYALGEQAPELSQKQKEMYNKLEATPDVPDAQRTMLRSYLKPSEQRDPIWKFRRGK
jgi:type II secretory pathway component GspD/PulD (secretin)